MKARMRYLSAEQICKNIRLGKDVTDDVARLEPDLTHYCRTMRKDIQDEAKFYLSVDYLTSIEDALYDVSPHVKAYWDTVYPLIQSQGGKYTALLRFVNAREDFLGIPHTDSVRILRNAGWSAADVMAAFLTSRHCSHKLTLSPDAAAEAVREDMDTALLLLERKRTDLFENGYDIYSHFEWIDFMYLFMEYEDRTFLTTQHKSKRLCQYCRKILDKLEYGPAQQDNVPEWSGAPDFSIFEGITLTQRHLMASAAGQRLHKGNDNNVCYVLSFHLVDEEHGYGAALRFDGIPKAPEYHNWECLSRGVYFYRFHYFIPFDYVPDSWRCNPSELPEDFVKKAYRSFSKLAGLEKKTKK